MRFTRSFVALKMTTSLRHPEHYVILVAKDLFMFKVIFMATSLIDRDLQHIWHPCSQMKDYETFKPLEIIGAQGAYLHLADGRRVIDAISSWWCKSLGHSHPRLKQALLQQAEKFEHVLLANTTNETIVALSEKLARLTNTLNKVSYASDGSCAVEMALKMSLHARSIQDEHQRTRFVALENAYHGETAGAMSVSDLALYRAPYKKLLFDTMFIHSIPYVSDSADPLWQDCSDHWQRIEAQLLPYCHEITAIIIEPIVQGAGGMKIYSQDFLRRLRQFTKQHGIHLIADEIMTGFGRTGTMLACEHANIEPDFLCLSKGLTAGWLPLSAMLTSTEMYNLFYDDYSLGNSFLHSHTHTGNALAASVALEVLTIVEEECICARANQIGHIMQQNMHEIMSETKKLKNIRSIGAIVAADLICDDTKRAGYEVYQRAIHQGALLRPLGNTIYWLPPLNSNEDTLTELKNITCAAL